MAEMKVSIGRVKRDISDLVNRVAYGGERVVLTSRGKPKAVLISLEDYDRLKAGPSGDSARWQAWLAESDQLNARVMARRQGQPLDLDEIWSQAREDLEERDDRLRAD